MACGFLLPIHKDPAVQKEKVIVRIDRSNIICKFTLTIKFEQYRLKKFEGEFTKLRRNKKLMDVLREIIEDDGNIAEIDLKVGDEEYCN